MKICHISVSSGWMKIKIAKITSDLKFTIADKQLFFQLLCRKLSIKARN